MGTNTLIIKDGNQAASALSMNSASSGLIPEHAINGVVTVTGTVASYAIPVSTYTNNRVAYPDNTNSSSVTSGWDYSNQSGTFLACTSSLNRKSLIITNKSYDNPAYILVGASDTSGSGQYGFSIGTVSAPPSAFSFILQASGTYFADDLTCALAHAVFVQSASNTISTRIAITEVI